MFWEKPRLERACSLSDLLSMIQPYINYEEEFSWREDPRNKKHRMWRASKKDNDCHRDDGERGPRARFSAYTPLTRRGWKSNERAQMFYSNNLGSGTLIRLESQQGQINQNSSFQQKVYMGRRAKRQVIPKERSQGTRWITKEETVLSPKEGIPQEI